MNVLYDSNQRVYLGRPASKKDFPILVKDKENAWVFSDKEVKSAWVIAYKCSWLGIGTFYVYGI